MLVRAFRDRALGALRKRFACSCSVRFCLVGVAMKPAPFDYQAPAPFAKQSTCWRRTPRRSSSPGTKPDAGSRLPPVDPEPAVDLRRLPGLGNIAVGDNGSVRSRIQRTRALRRINTAALFTAVPKVRIRFPPAASRVRTRSNQPYVADPPSRCSVSGRRFPNLKKSYRSVWRAVCPRRRNAVGNCYAGVVMVAGGLIIGFTVLSAFTAARVSGGCSPAASRRS